MKRNDKITKKVKLGKKLSALPTAKQIGRVIFNQDKMAQIIMAKTTEPDFMREALNQARYAAQAGEVPVGAVLVRENRIIAKAHNQTRGGHTYPPDPTAHAEICALRLACEALEAERLDDCDLYVTLEPCTMCAAAISFARIRRLYYGAADAKGGAVEHGSRFFSSPACFHAPELYPSLTERESEALLKEFFQKKRGK